MVKLSARLSNGVVFNAMFLVGYFRFFTSQISFCIRPQSLTVIGILLGDVFFEPKCFEVKMLLRETICLFGVLHPYQHCTSHITMGSFVGRGNQ